MKNIGSVPELPSKPVIPETTPTTPGIPETPQVPQQPVILPGTQPIPAEEPTKIPPNELVR